MVRGVMPNAAAASFNDKPLRARHCANIRVFSSGAFCACASSHSVSAPIWTSSAGHSTVHPSPSINVA
ncbi:MAG: hypothetical protein Q8O34_13505 [Rhodocyclaceae bacterium]|nr:hypothetical protein [Rhodocyclaceae bacterium]